MHSYRTVDWPQSNPYLVSFRKTARQPRNSPISEALDSASRTDMRIVQDVRNELRMEPSVRAAAIDVQASDGVVTLSGIVDSDAERWLIESAARRIAGVKRVVVQLKLFAANVTPTDDEIAHDCKRVLEDLTPASDYAIRVMVSNGWVTLSGYVAEGYERSIAETAISSLLSVHGVNSQLRVRPPLRARNGSGASNAVSGHHQNELKSGSYEFVHSSDGMTWSEMRNYWAARRAQLHAAWSAPGARRVAERIRPS